MPPLVSGPGNGIEEPLWRIRLPGDQEQFGIWDNGVDDLGTLRTVVIANHFETCILAKGFDDEVLRQRLAAATHGSR